MAEADVSGFNGDVALTGHGGEAYAFTMSVTQRKKSVGRYGSSRYNKSRGGVLDVRGSVTVFLRKGDVGTEPNADAAGMTPDGDALVLTASTGCTWTGVGVVDFSVNHRFDDPAIEGTYPFEGNGDWAEVWAAA